MQVDSTFFLWQQKNDLRKPQNVDQVRKKLRNDDEDSSDLKNYRRLSLLFKR